MESNSIRNIFLEFFKEKGHQIVPSAPMVVKNDPTLMFTNAGMNQFKDLFLGNAPVKYPRVADTQKCLRVSGKHNDLEEVGVDTYHHTMFEMLGNWSFGDYFKKEAIEWAWELLTKVYMIPQDRLYVTVFEGSKDDNLAFDQEAFDHWKKLIPEDRILNGNKKDNFWEMGDTGPCGPCSEIHVDIRDDEERKKVDAKELINNDHPQVIEIWNNVFMEFNRKADGSLEKLPAQHVDTGMGFERLCMVIQGKKSNYDTDIFRDYINFLSEKSGITYTGANDKQNVAMRVIADHIRAISFAIADGQLPSNTGAGYVIRRILRRAVRYGYSFLNFKTPFLFELVELLNNKMGSYFPELQKQKDLVERVIKEEETSFFRTLEKGIQRFNEYMSQKPAVVDGNFTFELYDTYGFPVDLTQLLAREAGVPVDMDAFNTALTAQKERSRAATSIDTEDWVELVKNRETQFVGYDAFEAETEILRYRKVKAKGKQFYQIVLSVTPFYAEGGGQVGDTGVLADSQGKEILITDTKKENGVIMHISENLPEDITGVFLAKVNMHKRLLTQNNHSATHLVHAALRQVLGTHVEQKGSLVNSQQLRFDFSHFSKITDEEITQIESIVNKKIREDIPLDAKLLPIEEAKKMGAMALFGEKYGETVRVVTFDPLYSIELCGGTHVRSTGQIGYFKITAESAVAAGIRRIEAVTAEKAEEYVNEKLLLIDELKEKLKATDLKKSIDALLEQNSVLNSRIEALMKEKAKSVKNNLREKLQSFNGLNVIIEQVNLDSADAIKDIAFQLKGEIESLFFVAASIVNEKPMLTVMISDNLVKEKNLNAGQIIRELSKEINGGGGGQAFYATAGGSNPAGLPKALEKAKELISSVS
jgi:alanyl-tRNA synthetase